MNLTGSRVFSLFEFESVIITNEKLSKILRITFILLVVPSIIIFFLIGDYSMFRAEAATIFYLILCLVFFLTSKYYNWTNILFIMVFIGVIYKKFHWPFSAMIMTLGTLTLSVICWYNSLKFFFDFRKNSFLKWFGFLSGIIVIFFMLGFLFMNLHWSGLIRSILLGSGSFLLVFSVLALVFTLPFSGYIAWSDIERKVFSRIILNSLLFVFFLFVLVVLFPDFYNSIMGRGIHPPPWSNFNIELKNLEGISSPL
jgi:hypothetical protein